MPAYSFMRRFVVPIAMGWKPHTVRADRKRHARPGEEIQLYHGMRTKACRLIGRATCAEVHSITLVLGPKIDANIATSPPYQPPAVTGDALDDFAIADGFEHWVDLECFWELKHPGKTEFDGVLIRWDPDSLRLSEWGLQHKQLALDCARDGDPTKLTEQFVKEWIGL